MRIKGVVLVFSVLLLVSLTCSLISAVKPEPQIISNGCEIRLPQVTTLTQNQDINFHTHVINTTTGANNFLINDTTTCFVHLYDHSGHIFQGNMSLDPNGLEWEINISGGNFSQIGEFAFYIQCQATDVICADSGSYEVTPSGKSAPTSGESLIYIGSLVAMILMTLLFFLVSFTMKSGSLKFGFIGLSMIGSIIVILYSAISLQEMLSGFVKITSSFSTFLYISLFVLLIIFLFVLLALTIDAMNSFKRKKGLKEE